MSVGPSVSQYVGNTLLFQHFWVVLSLPLLPKCLVSLITAPAHLHATLVAVFPAFFLSFLRSNSYIFVDLEKRERKKVRKKQVTRGHNIVVDGWAGASNPHPHPNTPSTHKHTQKVSKTLIFTLFDSIITDGLTDRLMDGPTDGQSLL